LTSPAARVAATAHAADAETASVPGETTPVGAA
jgi:hypothetical protein